MKIYKVNWVIREGGAYIPPDPVVFGGDCRSDLWGADIVTASTAKKAQDAVKAARPSAAVRRPEVLSEA